MRYAYLFFCLRQPESYTYVRYKQKRMQPDSPGGATYISPARQCWDTTPYKVKAPEGRHTMSPLWGFDH